MATMTLEIITQAFFVLPERMKHGKRNEKNESLTTLFSFLTPHKERGSFGGAMREWCHL